MAVKCVFSPKASKIFNGVRSVLLILRKAAELTPDKVFVGSDKRWKWRCCLSGTIVVSLIPKVGNFVLICGEQHSYGELFSRVLGTGASSQPCKSSC